MTDNAYLLKILKDGCWHSRDEILSFSFAERGCGMTVHSRAADLRKHGHTVECEKIAGAVGARGGNRRRQSFYRIPTND